MRFSALYSIRTPLDHLSYEVTRSVLLKLHMYDSLIHVEAQSLSPEQLVLLVGPIQLGVPLLPGVESCRVIGLVIRLLCLAFVLLGSLVLSTIG